VEIFEAVTHRTQPANPRMVVALGQFAHMHTKLSQLSNEFIKWSQLLEMKPLVRAAPSLIALG
jgi:hypothetical protein